MSLDSVQVIIGRAVSELEYRDLLFDNPDKALGGYDLTEEEAYALKKLQRKRFDAVAGELEERVSRAGLSMPGGRIMINPQPEPPELTRILRELGFGS